MGTFKTFLKLVLIVFETAFYLLLWVFSSIADFFKYQIKSISTEMRKDESNPQTTIDSAEMDRFSRLTDWWDPKGRLEGLHNINLVRIPFITNVLSKGIITDKPLKGIKILDVGCGGGFLSEPLARMGATVTGIDVCEALIDIADAHKHLDPELENNKPTYIATTVEEHIIKYNSYYDAVVASEVIDHVSNPEFFVKSCIQAVKPGGKIFFTAPNRTWITRFGLIFYLEYVRNVLPKGTHRYENFVTPKELSAILEKNNCRVDAIQGFFYNFLNYTWFSIDMLHYMYGLRATKIN